MKAPTRGELKILIDEREKQTDQRFAAQERSVFTATAALDKRLDTLNEFRGQLKDQAGTFVTRSEIYAFVGAVMFMIIGAAGVVIALVKMSPT